MSTPAKRSLFDQVTIGLAVFIFVGGIAFLSGSSRVHLFSPGTRVDLGDVGMGQTNEKAFSIHNPSSRPIVIVGWSPTCHCVQAEFPKVEVAPGQTVDGYVRTTATTPLGKRAASIAIQWHYLGETFVRTDNLIVSAKYVSPVTLSKDRLDFDSVPWNHDSSESLLVRIGNDASHWNNLEIAPGSDRLSAQIHSTPAGFRLQVDINPAGLPAGVWKSSVRLMTLKDGIRTGESVEVPVVARIEGPFSVNPQVLQFFDNHDGALSFTLRIHSSTVTIRKLRVLGPLVLKSTVEIAANGTDAIVRGLLIPPAGKELFVGKIPLQVNDGPEGYLQMSFIGYPG